MMQGIVAKTKILILVVGLPVTLWLFLGDLYTIEKKRSAKKVALQAYMTSPQYVTDREAKRIQQIKEDERRRIEEEKIRARVREEVKREEAARQK